MYSEQKAAQQTRPWRRGKEDEGEGGREQACPLVRDTKRDQPSLVLSLSLHMAYYLQLELRYIKHHTRRLNSTLTRHLSFLNINDVY